MARHKTLVVYVVAYLLAAGGTLRYLGYILSHPSQLAVLGLLAAFLVLLAIQPWLTRRSQRHMHLYLAVQTCILVALTVVTTIEDFAAIPFACLILQAMLVFPPRIGFRWIGIFTVIVVAFMMAYGIGYHAISWEMGLLTALVYATVNLLIGAFMAVIYQLEIAREEADTERDQSQKLLAELQDAHQQLQVYAAQAEELARAAERERAARALEAAHAFLQSIIDGLAESIMVIGMDYQIKLMNRAARAFSSKLVDVSKPLFCYQAIYQRETPCEGLQRPCPLDEVRATGQPVTVVHEHWQTDGERRFAEVLASPFLGPDGDFLGIIESIRDVTERMQAKEVLQQNARRLRALSARLADVAEAERQRLSRELHDQVGQNLTALGINLNIVRSQLPDQMSSSVRSRLDDSLSLVEQTTEEIRDVMANLRPPALDDYGLMAALHWYGGQFSRRTGIAIAVDGEEPSPRLAARVENALFRIAQEALTNVAKHAGAKHVMVALEVDDGTLRLVVADDGIGFDPVHLAEPDEGRGWGLLTMAERAEAFGGRCRIESEPGQGAQVIVQCTVFPNIREAHVVEVT